MDKSSPAVKVGDYVVFWSFRTREYNLEFLESLRRLRIEAGSTPLLVSHVLEGDELRLFVGGRVYVQMPLAWARSLPRILVDNGYLAVLKRVTWEQSFISGEVIERLVVAVEAPKLGVFPFKLTFRGISPDTPELRLTRIALDDSNPSGFELVDPRFTDGLHAYSPASIAWGTQ